MCSSQEQPMLESSNCWICLEDVLPAQHDLCQHYNTSKVTLSQFFLQDMQFTINDNKLELIPSSFFLKHEEEIENHLTSS